VSFDHVTKDKDGRGRYALGGVHKLNIVNGAGYTLENRQPFGIGVTGRSTLKIAKDRPGQLRRNAMDKWYGDLVLASNTDGTADVSIESPQERVAERETAEPFRPTTLMEKVSKYIEDEGQVASQNQILDGVDGKRDWKIAALRLLKEEGYVTPTKPYESLSRTGRKTINDHETLRCSPVPQVFPKCSPGNGCNHRSPVPHPLHRGTGNGEHVRTTS
jgi:hypothetical protein